jgi:hypothetical protein
MCVIINKKLSRGREMMYHTKDNQYEDDLEILRKELEEVIDSEQHYNLIDEEILNLSIRLDKVIVKIIKNEIKRSA